PGAGDLDQGAQGGRRGAVAAVVRQFAGGVVAPDQRAVPDTRIVLGVDPGPVVVARALGPTTRTIALPHATRQVGGDLVESAADAPVHGDAVVAGHREHIAQAQGLDPLAQGRVVAVDLVSGDERGGHPGGARGSRPWAWA